jgi:hypothetical protein
LSPLRGCGRVGLIYHEVFAVMSCQTEEGVRR